MPEPPRSRSLAATVVGYVLVAVLAFFVLRLFVGTIFWLARAIVVLLVIGALFALYVKLKLPKE